MKCIVVFVLLHLSFCVEALPKVNDVRLTPKSGGTRQDIRGGGVRAQAKKVIGKKKDEVVETKQAIADKKDETFARKSSNQALLGAIGLAGGGLIHLVLGSFYCVPNLVSYALPQVQYFGNGGSGKPDALYAMALTLGISSCIMPLGAKLATEVSTSFAALLGGLIASLSMFLASYSTKCWHFLVLQGIVFGIGHGTAYTAPMIAGWRVFPNRRGLVSGTVLTLFGAAAFVWGPLITFLINPENVPPPFPTAVTERLAPTLRTLAVAFAATSAIGVGLMAFSTSYGGTPVISIPKKTLEKAKKEATSTVMKPPRSAGSIALTSPIFWLAWLICLLNASAALNVAALWKGFAAAAGSEALRADDRALALAGSLSALGNGFGRLFWATISDTVGLGPSYLSLGLIQFASMLALGPVALRGSPTAFACNLGIIFFCLGGIFSLSPPLASALFGPSLGPRIYGFIFSAFPVASVGGQLLAQLILAKVGWHNLLRILAGVAATALLPLIGLYPRLLPPQSCL